MHRKDLQNLYFFEKGRHRIPQQPQLCRLNPTHNERRLHEPDTTRNEYNIQVFNVRVRVSYQLFSTLALELGSLAALGSAVEAVAGFCMYLESVFLIPAHFHQGYYSSVMRELIPDGLLREGSTNLSIGWPP